jgi:hypothetical protein
VILNFVAKIVNKRLHADAQTYAIFVGFAALHFTTKTSPAWAYKLFKVQHDMSKIVIFVVFFVSNLAFAGEQMRTFTPDSQVFYGGLGSAAWFSDSPAVCGVQLKNDCWGHFVGYVKESTPGAKMICSTLLAAKASKTSVEFVMDVTALNQCEVVQVNYN